MRRILLWVRHPPFSTNHLAEAIRVAAMASALELEVTFAFVGDGVWALAAGQSPHRLGPPIGSVLRGIVTEASPALVDGASLAARGLTAARLVPDVPVRVVDAEELADRLVASDSVVTQ